MTYNMLAQGEDLHIGAWPFTPDEGTDDLVWRSGEVNMAAARVYATNSCALSLLFLSLLSVPFPVAILT